MQRRSFLSKIGSAFERQGEFAFFGLQTVINVFGEEGLRAGLHGVIESGGSIETPAEKNAYYKRIAALLLEDVPFIEYGFWDLLTKKGEAEEEFYRWVTEINASMATEEEELGEEIDEMFRMSSDKSYVVVTLLFLLENHVALNPFFDKINGVEEDEYFTKSGFTELIKALPLINFEFSHGDASFVMPGNDEDGISWEDIKGEGWEYLKPVTL